MNSQELRSLQEAYLDVCENSLLNAIDSTARTAAGTIGGGIGERQARRQVGNLPVLGDVAGSIGKNQGTQKGKQFYDNAKQAVGGLLKQSYEYDLFDYILEYLVAEGYADTNENAIAIMSNMSEEWRQSIVEDVYMGPPIKQEKPQPKVEKKPPASPGRVEAPASPGRAEGGTGLPPGQVPPNVRKYASGG